MEETSAYAATVNAAIRNEPIATAPIRSTASPRPHEDASGDHHPDPDRQRSEGGDLGIQFLTHIAARLDLLLSRRSSVGDPLVAVLPSVLSPSDASVVITFPLLSQR